MSGGTNEARATGAGDDAKQPRVATVSKEAPAQQLAIDADSNPDGATLLARWRERVLRGLLA
ncbi:MAG TPA: hypothetical protein VHZ95_18975, partial [Polyangiales bacterium]|nr:hypothetical protein [Polyangiales bacterium]